MYSPNTSPKKPSPLSYGTPSATRASPFKRPPSAAGSNGSAPNTPRSPAASRSGNSGPAPAAHTPTRTPGVIDEEEDTTDVFTAPAYPTVRPSSRGTSSPLQARSTPPQSQSYQSSTPGMSGGSPSKNVPRGAVPPGQDTATKIPPALLREMHESFQAMDQDDDGQVNSSDVADALGQLGQDALPATLTTFFPPNSPPAMGLPSYINSLSGPLGSMSTPAELAAAFSAFDADDSGQIDVAELREALLATHDGGVAMTPREVDSVIGEFAGKRAFARGNVGNRGDVFRWREFVNATGGGPERKEDAKA